MSTAYSEEWRLGTTCSYYNGRTDSCEALSASAENDDYMLEITAQMKENYCIGEYRDCHRHLFKKLIKG